MSHDGMQAGRLLAWEQVQLGERPLFGRSHLPTTVILHWEDISSQLPGCLQALKGTVTSVHYAQAGGSTPGGRPCHPAVPGCVVIVGKGPWSCEQRLGVVSSVRCGAPIVRTAWCCVPLPMGAWDVLTPCACDFCAFASHLRSGAHVECPGAVVAPL